MSAPSTIRRTGRIAALSVVCLATLVALSASADTVRITGAGATFPYPLYSKWFAEYQKVDPSTEVNYQSIGSGGGIRQLLDRTVDFGASDAPMTDEQLAKSASPILHFPTVLGAVVITYNLPSVTQPLKLSGDVIADIFLGKITQWTDPRIVAMNPGVALPGDPILIAHRSDGSGTTAVFSDYLSKVSPEWKQKVGSGTALNWPAGLGGKGNEGVTGLVKQTPGAVGYIELTYAVVNHLPYADLKNSAGVFVTPSPASVTAAAASVARSMPKDFRVSVTNASGRGAYPISSFTYLLLYRKMDAEKGGHLKKFLGWAMTDGQKMAEPMAYAPLPKSVLLQVKKRIQEIQTN